MPKVIVTRPPVTLEDDQSATLSTHDYEHEAVVAAEDQPPSTYTIIRPTITIEVTD